MLSVFRVSLLYEHTKIGTHISLCFPHLAPKMNVWGVCLSTAWITIGSSCYFICFIILCMERKHTHIHLHLKALSEGMFWGYGSKQEYHTESVASSTSPWISRTPVVFLWVMEAWEFGAEIRWACFCRVWITYETQRPWLANSALSYEELDRNHCPSECKERIVQGKIENCISARLKSDPTSLMQSLPNDQAIYGKQEESTWAPARDCNVTLSI